MNFGRASRLRLAFGAALLFGMAQSTQAGTITQVVVNYTGTLGTVTKLNPNATAVLNSGGTITGSFVYLVGSVATPVGVASGNDVLYNFTGSSATHAFNVKGPTGSNFSDQSVAGAAGHFLLDLNPVNNTMELIGDTVQNPDSPTHDAFDLLLTGIVLPVFPTGTLPISSAFLAPGYKATLNYDPPDYAFTADITITDVTPTILNVDPALSTPEPASIATAVLGAVATSYVVYRRRKRAQ